MRATSIPGVISNTEEPRKLVPSQPDVNSRDTVLDRLRMFLVDVQKMPAVGGGGAASG
jgi:hypothetical protein